MVRAESKAEWRQNAIRLSPAFIRVVFQYSEVIKNLTKRDFKLRYRSSVFGFAWSFLNPLSFMLVMSFVFTVIFPSTLTNYPYPVFLLCGLLPWRFFAVGTSQSLQSIVGNSALVSKVYFPRQILVLSTILANFIGTLIEFTILFPLMLALGVPIGPYTPLFLLMLGYEFLFVYSISLVLSALFVFYRDLMHLWEVFLNLAVWVAPIMYPISMVPAQFLSIYWLNPIVPLITTFQYVLLFGKLPHLTRVLQMIGTLIIGLTLGIFVFRHFEPRFADEVA